MKVKLILLAVLLVTGIGCQKEPPKPIEVLTEAPHTGDSEYEEEKNPQPPKSDDKLVGREMYVAAQRLRLRSSAQVQDSLNIIGVLYPEDKVKILKVDSSADGMVEIEILQSSNHTLIGKTGFVAVSYLTEMKPEKSNSTASDAGAAPKAQATKAEKPKVPQYRDTRQFFIIQNIATEKIRVYQKCANRESNCKHKLILEEDMVAGEDTDEYRTRLGHYRIQSWVKFYEDGAKKYPAWYRDGYPELPVKDASLSEWMKDSYLPNGIGVLRGAFGWYAALVGPNAAGQWTHGTIGWAETSREAIEFKDSFSGWIANLFKKIRSSGCSRVSNPAIAYLQWRLPTGTPILKVYAKEKKRNTKEKLSDFNHLNIWEFVLTKDQSGKSNPMHSWVGDIKNRERANEALETGDYKYSSFATAAAGDVYDLGRSAFAGTYWVDEGVLESYTHPKEMVVGGHTDELIPHYMKVQ